VSKVRSKITAIPRWFGERSTLIGLIIIQPAFNATVLKRGMTSQAIGNLTFPISFIVIVLGLYASLRIRQRSPSSRFLRTKPRNPSEDILDGAWGLLAPIILLTSVQMTLRKTFTIKTDPVAKEMLGYVPSEDVMNHIIFGTTIWALISAYVIKYYWDDLITLLECRAMPPEN